MNRKQEEIFYNRLKALRDKVVKKENIEVGSEYYGYIELVLIELLEFAQYSNFRHDKKVLYTDEQLIDFLSFYTERTHVNCIVSQFQCVDILELLFDFEL